MKAPAWRQGDHPGLLLRGHLRRCGISTSALALWVGLSGPYVSNVASGRKGISAEFACRLARAFGTSATYWMRAQVAWEVRSVENSMGRKLRQIRKMPRIRGMR